MAAALGVTPMILSRSPLWSPMASVIAVGLVVSMVFTLIVVPVLYVVVERAIERRTAGRAAAEGEERERHTPVIPAAASLRAGALAMLASLLLSAVGRPAEAQDTAPLRLTLDSAVQVALAQGMSVRIAELQVRQAAAQRRGAQADYLPRLAASGNRVQSSGTTRIVIPQGVLGDDGTGAPVPATMRSFEQGSSVITYGQLSLMQPLTQLYRVRQAEALAAARERGAEIQRRRTALDIALEVQQLFLGALDTREKARAAAATLTARQRQLADAERATAAGAVLRVEPARARATVLDAKYALVTARNEAEDREAELREALGVAQGTPLELVPPDLTSEALQPLAEYLARARANSPELASAHVAVEQARRAVSLARADYIPDIGIGLTYTYQDGVPFLPRSSAALAIQGTWTVWDFGKRSAAMRERQAGVALAQLALQHAEDKVAIAVEKAYRRAERAAVGAVAARAAIEARRDALRIAADRERQGLVLAAFRAEAEASEAASEAEAISASLGEWIARAELARVVGDTLERPARRTTGGF
jgi:outer membrane protein TolC